MVLLTCCRRWVLALLALGLAGSPAAASEAAKLLPAGTDLVLTVNVRQFLEDHKNTAAVQGFLEPWRLALRGDEKDLKQYHRARNLLGSAGITEQDFLDRARTLRSFSDSLGLNPLEDVDRISCGLQKSDRTAWVVLVEGRFKKERLRPPAKVRLALLAPGVLALTARKQEMDQLQARGSPGAKEGAISPGLRGLLEKTEREQVALVVDRVDALLKEAAKVGTGQIAKLLGVEDNAAGKRALDQVAAWALQEGQEIACAGVGVSIHEEESRLQWCLVCKGPEKGKSLSERLDRGKVWAALAARLIDSKLLHRLGDILLRADVIGTGETVVVRARVPHEFVWDVVNESLTTLHPLTERVQRQVMSIPIWGPVQPPPPGALPVEEVRDIAYRDDAAADPIRHRLDLFVPRGKKNCPVVVLVHGGGWIMGDNRCCGLHSSVGHFLASQFAAVLPNYRLSPQVRHPEHVKDVARAVRWARDHIAEHGGSPERIVLAGHSAGGHLVALLATDESYLKVEGLSLRDIKGVIPMSGVYRILPGKMEGFLGGSGNRSLRPDQVVPLRGGGGLLPVLPPLGLAIKMDVFGPGFGPDPKVRASASPLNHVRRGLPPFLILVAEHDLPTLAGTAEEFHQALRRAGCTARLLKVPNRNHNSLLFSAITPEDPAARAMLGFLREGIPGK